MIKIVKIGDKDITLNASVWTWLEYKRIFKRDWHSDRSAQLAATLKALEFQHEYGGLTEEQFSELPKEKQDAYWRGLEENKADTEFALDTIYAMAVAGGYLGSRKDMFGNMSPAALDPDSELMMAFAELVNEFFPVLKKKTM